MQTRVFLPPARNLTCILGLAITVGGISAFIDANPPSRALGLRVFASIIFLSGLLLFIMSIRVSVTTTSNGVRVRKVVRTVNIPWEDVAGFSAEAADGPGLWPQDSVVVKRRSGEVIRTGVTSPRRIRNRETGAVQGLVRELNRLWVESGYATGRL